MAASSAASFLGKHEHILFECEAVGLTVMRRPGAGTLRGARWFRIVILATPDAPAWY